MSGRPANLPININPRMDVETKQMATKTTHGITEQTTNMFNKCHPSANSCQVYLGDVAGQQEREVTI